MTRVPTAGAVAPTGAWCVAVLLTLANAIGFADRQILVLLVEPIKADLGISDTAISVLMGFSFSVTFALLGLPLARLADRSDRSRMLVIMMFSSGIMTAAGGLARSFGALLVARIGLAASEAGLSPTSQSLLASYFPRQRLPAALGLHAMGMYLGSGIVLICGGTLLHYFDHGSGQKLLDLVGGMRPWHATMIALALPGLVLALAMLVIAEPRRVGGANRPQRAMPLAEMWAHVLTAPRGYFGLMLGLALMVLVGQGTASWIPAFFERRFAWTAEEIGQYYGTIVLLCGSLGALSGGFATSALRSLGVKRANFWIVCTSFGLLVPITISFPLMPTVGSALTLIGLMNFFAGMPFGGCYAALQEMSPEPMRAQIMAMTTLAINLIGAGLGPTVIALVTDNLFADPASLPQALSLVAAIVSPLALLCVTIALRGYAPPSDHQ